MMTKYSKKGVKTSDFIHQYCDHRDICSYCGKQCCLQRLPKRIVKRDIAYIHNMTCDNFRTVEDGIIGAEVQEIGIWIAAGIVSVA